MTTKPINLVTFILTKTFLQLSVLTRIKINSLPWPKRLALISWSHLRPNSVLFFLGRFFLFLEQSSTHLRAFACAIPTAWDFFPPGHPMVGFFSSVKFYLMCCCLSQAFLDHLSLHDPPTPSMTVLSALFSSVALVCLNIILLTLYLTPSIRMCVLWEQGAYCMLYPKKRVVHIVGA